MVGFEFQGGVKLVYHILIRIGLWRNSPLEVEETAVSGLLGQQLYIVAFECCYRRISFLHQVEEFILGFAAEFDCM